MIDFTACRGSRATPGADHTKPSACRELVAVSPVKSAAGTRPRHGKHASAAFLAHLIATAEDFPQTREKRRLAPDQASRLYAAAQSRRGAKSLRLNSL